MLKKSITKANSGVAALILFSVAFALYAWYAYAQIPRIADPSLRLHERSEPVELPYLEKSSPKVRRFDVDVTMRYAAGQTTRFKVVPDDCLKSLTVNGVAADLSRVVNGSLCNYSKGFEIDLAPYLAEGENRLRLSMSDGGGSRGLSFEPIHSKSQTTLLKSMLLAWGVLLGFVIARWLGFSSAVSILIGLGLAIRFFYLWETPWSLRTHDADGHLDYIRQVAESFWIGADACWMCYHPPLYYMLAAGVYKLFALAGNAVAFVAVQLFSLLLNFGFVLFALLSLRLHLGNRFAMFAASALILFMPSLIMHSVRVGNDALLYFAYAGAFYFYLRWLRTSHGLGWMIGFAVIALLAKTTGLLVMGVVGIAYLARTALVGKFRTALKPIALTVSVFAAAIAVTLLLQHVRGGEGLVGNTDGLNNRLYVHNEPVNYLYFDYETYVKEPFTSPWKDELGRQYFWNYLLKTSLFGEFSFGGETMYALGSGIGMLYLLVLLGALYALAGLRNYEVLGALPFALNAVVLLAAAVYLRISVPASCSNDFRYILPLVISLAYFLGLALQKLQRDGRAAYWVLAAAALGMSAMNAAFIFSV